MSLLTGPVYPVLLTELLCSHRKHYREYLVSLINAHSLDPAPLYDAQELIRNCERYLVDKQRAENEDDNAYHARLLKVRRTRPQLEPKRV